MTESKLYCVECGTSYARHDVRGEGCETETRGANGLWGIGCAWCGGVTFEEWEEEIPIPNLP